MDQWSDSEFILSVSIQRRFVALVQYNAKNALKKLQNKKIAHIQNLKFNQINHIFHCRPSSFLIHLLANSNTQLTLLDVLDNSLKLISNYLKVSEIIISGNVKLPDKLSGSNKMPLSKVEVS